MLIAFCSKEKEEKLHAPVCFSIYLHVFVWCACNFILHSLQTNRKKRCSVCLSVSASRDIILRELLYVCRSVVNIYFLQHYWMNLVFKLVCNLSLYLSRVWNADMFEGHSAGHYNCNMLFVYLIGLCYAGYKCFNSTYPCMHIHSCACSFCNHQFVLSKTNSYFVCFSVFLFWRTDTESTWKGKLNYRIVIHDLHWFIWSHVYIDWEYLSVPYSCQLSFSVVWGFEQP